jgi:hypothetical protein
LNKLFAQLMNYFVSYLSLFPTVKTFPLVLCLALLLSVSNGLQAQTGDVVDSTAAAIEDVEDDGEITGAYQKITIPEPLELRQVPDSTVHSLKKKKEFAYANDPEYWVKEPERQVETNSGSNSKGFWSYFNEFFSGTAIRTITYGVLIAFFLFVIYRIIVVNKLFLFYSSKKMKAAVNDEAIDIADQNLDEKIQHAVAARDYRMAVRYMYLKALQLLNEKQWIRYHANGTNYEYVNQMSTHKQASEFSFLTRVYEYVWYGEFTITAEQFDLVHKNFSHFYNAVKP